MIILSNKLKIFSIIIDEYSKEYLHSVLYPLIDLSPSTAQIEIICHYLNKGLGAYGFESYPSPYKTMVLIHDKTICHIVAFLNNKCYQPQFPTEQIDPIKTIAQVAKSNKVDIL